MLTFTFLVSPTPEQIQQIIALYRTEGWWSEGPDDPDLVARIVAGSHCFMIVTRGRDIIGMGRAISDGASDAYIQDVTVQQTYRSRGIGTRIIEELVARLHRDGLEWIGLIAEKNSYQFYERLGFKKMPNSVPMLKKGP
ncbi:MAG: GNAT family N-acetyltransferase [Thermodesulfobacteriota bacterium]